MANYVIRKDRSVHQMYTILFASDGNHNCLKTILSLTDNQRLQVSLTDNQRLQVTMSLCADGKLPDLKVIENRIGLKKSLLDLPKSIARLAAATKALVNAYGVG